MSAQASTLLEIIGCKLRIACCEYDYHGASPVANCNTVCSTAMVQLHCFRGLSLRNSNALVSLAYAWTLLGACKRASCQLPAASCTHCLPQECEYHGSFEAALVFSASCIYGKDWHPTTCLLFSDGGNRFVQCGMALYVWQAFRSRELQLS